MGDHGDDLTGIAIIFVVGIIIMVGTFFVKGVRVNSELYASGNESIENIAAEEAAIREVEQNEQRNIIDNALATLEDTDNTQDMAERASLSGGEINQEEVGASNKEQTEQKLKEIQERANGLAYNNLRSDEDLRYLEITELGKSNNKFYTVVHDIEASYYGIIVVSPEEYGRLRLGQKLRVKRRMIPGDASNPPHFKYSSFNREGDMAIIEFEQDSELIKSQEVTLDIIEKFQYFPTKHISCSMLKLWDSSSDTVISIEINSKAMNYFEIGDKINTVRTVYGMLDNGGEAYMYETDQIYDLYSDTRVESGI